MIPAKNLPNMTERQPDDNAPVPAGGKPRRRFRFYLLLFFVALIAAHQIFNLIAGLRLKAEFRRIRASGAPVTLAEAAPPEVPDNQNAALSYQRAYEGLHGWPELQPLNDYLAYLQRPQSNTSPPMVKVASALAASADYFRLLEAGSRLPVSRFPVDWQSEKPSSPSHWEALDLMTQMLLARAIVAAKQERPEEAWESLATIVRIAEHIGAEPSSSAWLMKSDFVNLVFLYSEEILTLAPPTKSQSEDFYQVLKRAEASRPLYKILELERAEGIWDFDYIRREGPARLVYGRWRSRRGPNLFDNLWRLFRPFWEPFLKLDELYFLEQKTAVIEEAKRTLPPSRSRSWLRRTPKYALFSRILWRPPQFTQNQYSGLIAQLRIMQIAMALRGYQIKQGRYPETLEELAGSGWEIPLDPFSGKPLIYRKSGVGYLLYSVDKNRKDDGGAPSKDTRAWRQGNKDIVLQVEK